MASERRPTFPAGTRTGRIPTAAMAEALVLASPKRGPGGDKAYPDTPFYTPTFGLVGLPSTVYMFQMMSEWAATV